MNRRTRNILIIGAVGIVFIIAISVIGAIYIHLAPAFTLVLYAGLIVVTMVYAYFSMEIAEATRHQANASVQVAEEMREQRVMSSRPVIIQKAIPTEVVGTGFSDHFEIYNAGNGPAIELEILLLDKDKKLLQSERRTFVRAGEPPINFHPSNLGSHLNSTCYLLCRYQSILSRGAEKQTWYQTWLPFEPVKSQGRDYVYVKSGELGFCEVSEKKSY